ncbi:MAG: alpha/beta hydrolase [Isosphaeraceae bacterium]
MSRLTDGGRVLGFCPEAATRSRTRTQDGRPWPKGGQTWRSQRPGAGGFAGSMNSRTVSFARRRRRAVRRSRPRSRPTRFALFPDRGIPRLPPRAATGYALDRPGLYQRGRSATPGSLPADHSGPAGGRPRSRARGAAGRWVRRQDLGVTASSFARDGYVVAVADYTYSSGKPGSKVWPTNITNVRDAVRWLKANAGRYGIDPNRVAVWGESGGHLAAGGHRSGWDRRRAAHGEVRGDFGKVRAVVDFYGPTDLDALYDQSDRTKQYLLTFLGGRPTRSLTGIAMPPQ